MKLVKPLFACTLILACVTSSIAGGRHGHSHHRGARVGVFIGVPLTGAYYYSPRYYYSPHPYYYAPAPVVAASASPPVYIEQGNPQESAQLPSNYWYYCHNPQGYYPYVKDCSVSWQRVDPQPPSRR